MHADDDMTTYFEALTLNFYREGWRQVCLNIMPGTQASGSGSAVSFTADEDCESVLSVHQTERRLLAAGKTPARIGFDVFNVSGAAPELVASSPRFVQDQVRGVLWFIFCGGGGDGGGWWWC